MDRNVRIRANDGSYIQGVKEAGVVNVVPWKLEIVPSNILAGATDEVSRYIFTNSTKGNGDGAGEGGGENKKGMSADDTETAFLGEA